jgi:alpha-beta hydrolase superfamily lysophospholipase
MRSLGALALLACATTGCSGDDETTKSSGPDPNERNGCETSVSLLVAPEDAAERGPWPVGSRVVTVAHLSAEVWYPAELGSESGLEPKRYDVREWLPPAERDKIPDSDNPWQDSTTFADLPLDQVHGPYPALVFVHGTAGWRTQSLALLEHWASRGFIVLAADHPGLYLGDLLALQTQRDLEGDLAALLNAITTTPSGLEFLAGRIDTTRLGMVGHSAGGGAIAAQGSTSGVRVLIPLAAGGTMAGSSLESTLVMGGRADGVVDYGEQVAGYDASPPRKRLVGIEKAGHLFPTDLCHLHNAAGEDLVEIAQKYQIQNAQFASLLFDCPSDEPSAETNRAITSFATATVLEETLLCDDRASFDGMTTRYPEVTELREQL